LFQKKENGNERKETRKNREEGMIEKKEII
jgi:hypothetical protein